MVQFIFTDEEDVDEETRKHKKRYFGEKSNANRPSKNETVPIDALNAEDINMGDDIAPVNFLFSNDIDSDETNHNDEPIH